MTEAPLVTTAVVATVVATAALTVTVTDTDTCPRCGGAFHCGASDPAPCACIALQLPAQTLADLRQRYDGCLCLACLALFASPSVASTVDPFESLTSR